MAEEKIISIITINYNGLKDTCELMDTLIWALRGATTSVSKLPVVSTYISSTTIPCCISKTNQ